MQVEFNHWTVPTAAGGSGPGPGAGRQAAAVPADLPCGAGLQDRGHAGTERTADPGAGPDPSGAQARPPGPGAASAGPEAAERPSGNLHDPAAAADQQHAALQYGEWWEQTVGGGMNQVHYQSVNIQSSLSGKNY